MAKRFLVLIALLMLGFYVAGCAEGDESASVVNPNPSTVSPTGSISGVVMDACTSSPVSGAVVSVAYTGAVHQVTTGTTGAFSFANVPANWVAGSDFDWGADEGYYVTCDLTDDSDYGYAVVQQVWVAAGDLNDGDNYAMDDAESGSGADTPVHNLGNSMIFEVGPLNSSLAGTIYDVTTGRDATAATVALYYDGIFVASTSTTTGAYSFTGIAPGWYDLMVTKAGYEYAAYQPDKIDDWDNTCGWIELDCYVPCNSGIANVDVNLTYNPDKDVTRPFITQIDADANEDLWDGDEDLDESIEEFTVTFSEVMRTTHYIKAAVALTSNFAVTVNSSGGDTTTTQALNIIDDYTVTMSSAGVMSIDVTYLADADIIEAVLGLAGVAWDAEEAEIEGFDGGYTITFANNGFLADAAQNAWDATDDDDGADAGAPYNAPASLLQALILGGLGSTDFAIGAEFDELD